MSERRVQQIWREYRETGRIPELKRRGRKPRNIDKETIELVLNALPKCKLTSPVHLEKYIERRHNIHIPHNRIYTILKEMGITQPRKKKKKPKRFNVLKPTNYAYGF
ncbi:hypothetical protein [Methanotorris formicicus]|uniref:hypothetical protein n=1 Tax=Methanotorris formicicus TaxID=213185 RepID=UPI001FE224BE|nr:hypothetical protein [Methanotorris formicicus]